MDPIILQRNSPQNQLFLLINCINQCLIVFSICLVIIFCILVHFSKNQNFLSTQHIHPYIHLLSIIPSSHWARGGVQTRKFVSPSQTTHTMCKKEVTGQCIDSVYTLLKQKSDLNSVIGVLRPGFVARILSLLFRVLFLFFCLS